MDICDKRFWRCAILGPCFIALCPTAALAANSITGVVRNQTRGQFAVGAEAILLRPIPAGPDQPGLDQYSLHQNMQEEARTKTDSQGSFSLSVKYPNQPHLLRVVYKGINYDQLASVGEVISVEVFDVAPAIRGLTGSIEIIRIAAHGDHLHVSDMIEIRNDSSPPVTEASERTFETYLPARGKLNSVLAAGPEKIASLIPATPIPGEPGHYAVNFPMRPGATKFAFNYDLPYAGHAALRIRNKYPLQQLAVMIPPTMKFTSQAAAFQILRTGDDRYQVEAANMVRAEEGLAFEISGIGVLPALQPQAQSQLKPLAATPSIVSPAVAKSNGHRSQAANASDQAFAILPHFSGVQWWVLSAGTMILGVGVVLFRRAQYISRTTTKTAHTEAEREMGKPANTVESMVDALKGELRQLEIDRALGAISREEYASVRQALEGTVKRAMARAGQTLL